MATADQGYLIESLDTQGAGADILKLRWFPNHTPLEGTLLISGDADGVLDIEVSPPDADTWSLHTRVVVPDGGTVLSAFQNVTFPAPVDVRFNLSTATSGTAECWLHVLS